MPGRGAHRAIGSLSGGFVGALACHELPQQARIVYCLSAALGGFAFGTFPDVLEPATHPNHRDVCHSFAAGLGLLLASGSGERNIGADMRNEAARLRAERLGLASDDPRRPTLAFREYAIYFLLGLATGAVTGYLSHIAADMTTPREVPLVSRKLL